MNSVGSLTKKRVVDDLGFDQILKLSVTEIQSRRLAFWVVDNFDSCSCKLVLEKMNKLQVDPLDEHSVFGFPMGDISIVNIRKMVQSELINEYMNISRGW